MRLFSSIRAFASALFRRSRFEHDMDAELRAHIDDRANDLERSGLSRAEAERRARLDFGGYQKFKEECREAIGTHFVMTESVLLSLAGGCVGLMAAKWGLKTMLAALPWNIPRVENIGVNFPVLLFVFGISVAVGILFGLAPALKSSRLDLQTSLKEGGRGSTARHRVQNSLVIVQMALTVVLLAGAGLLFRTIWHLRKIDPGFDAQHVVTFQVGLSPSDTKSGAAVRTAFQQLTQRIARIPGVEAADLTTQLPLSHSPNDVPFWVAGQRPASVAEAPRAVGSITGPNYLRVMGIPLLRGRFIKDTDTIHSPRVVVIDSDLASAYFPNQDPVGHTITFPQVGDYRIVGVVGHVAQGAVGLSNPFTRNEAYVSIYQIQDRWLPTMDTWTAIAVRTHLDETRGYFKTEYKALKQ